MRSVLHNLVVVAIVLALFGATSKMLSPPLRPPTQDKYIEAEPNTATTRYWYFNPKRIIPIPLGVVPPPPNHESILRIKATS